jgi:N-acetylmuramoyl-L-alanine amidase
MRIILFVFLGLLFFVLAQQSLAEAFLIQGTERSIQTSVTKIEGVEYIPLVYMCNAFGVSYSWDSLTNRVQLYNKGKSLTVLLQEPVVDIDGQITELVAAPQILKGTVFVPVSMTQLAWWGRIKKPAVKKPKEIKPVPKKYLINKIILDPGHGGKDRGAFSISGQAEKDLVLAFSKKLKKELEKRGMEVLLTRDRDFFVSLLDRVKMANQTDGDLFISIHANAHPSPRAHGFEIFHLSAKDDIQLRFQDMMKNGDRKKGEIEVISDKYRSNPTLWDIVFTENRREAIDLARYIDRSIQRENIVSNRGVKGAGYYVLKWIDKPAVLIELGFMTNLNENKNLHDKAYIDRFIQALVLGIVQYRNEYEKKYKS